jgi:hypothetical protein
MRERAQSLRNRNLLQKQDDGPASAGPSSCGVRVSPRPCQDGVGSTRRSRMRTASTRFSRTDSTRIE